MGILPGGYLILGQGIVEIIRRLNHALRQAERAFSRLSRDGVEHQGRDIILLLIGQLCGFFNGGLQYARGIFFREYLGNSCICCLFMSIYGVEGSGNIPASFNLIVQRKGAFRHEVRNTKYEVHKPMTLG